MEKIFESFLASPQLLNITIKEMVSKYKPLVYSIFNEGFEIYKDLNSNDEYFEQKAISKKKMYDAYCKVGFTSSEAMLFILGTETLKSSIIKNISNLSNINNRATDSVKS